MIPQTITETQEKAEEARPEEPYIRQVEDHSLPAQQILIEQQECRTPDDEPVVFVP